MKIIEFKLVVVVVVVVVGVGNVAPNGNVINGNRVTSRLRGNNCIGKTITCARTDDTINELITP